MQKEGAWKRGSTLVIWHYLGAACVHSLDTFAVVPPFLGISMLASLPVAFAMLILSTDTALHILLLT